VKLHPNTDSFQRGWFSFQYGNKPHQNLRALLADGATSASRPKLVTALVTARQSNTMARRIGSG